MAPGRQCDAAARSNKRGTSFPILRKKKQYLFILLVFIILICCGALVDSHISSVVPFESPSGDDDGMAVMDHRSVVAKPLPAA